MKENNTRFEDFAIILTWPDATIRGDEKWMMFFKKLGIVKNLNFKVGHTGVVIVSRRSGEMLYYDFGRYIAPRGYGRARSKFSDPLLNLEVKAEFDNGKVSNLQEIVEGFEKIKPYMYGEGILYFSVVDGINFNLAKQYGDECVMEGTYPYGAVAKNNNNCSRFITRMLMRSSHRFPYWHGINLPETIKASPISNVVNAVKNRMIYSYEPMEGLKHFRMNRWQSFFFLLQKLSDNVYTHKASLLPEDQTIGEMKFKSKSIVIPKEACYLGGVGDGAWYDTKLIENEQIKISRFTSNGELEYVVVGKTEQSIDLSKPWIITYDSHLMHSHILLDDGTKVKIRHLHYLVVGKGQKDESRSFKKSIAH